MNSPNEPADPNLTCDSNVENRGSDADWDQGLAAAFGSGATAGFPKENEQVGAVIAGKYKLVELIGEGGMGSVWLAQQTEPVKRNVAVKLIKAGMDSKQVIARFEAERQALAVMDHPNIAKVLDGGLHDNRPYFVMELVKGVPITQYCDAKKLTPRERLELFVPVCQAIQHAHQKGIIHRDIKPSNVLIAPYDDKPVPKVIDFGLAKATGVSLIEASQATNFGGVVGTPQYMSPEQASRNNLDIDTRSDIYALGVLLYELLTGSPPFKQKELEKAGMLEMLRVIREVEPQRPSTKLSTSDALPSLSANRGTEPNKLTGLLRNELDWIVMKALEKDRTRRYETANGFAADVNRYLSGEAVLAHPPSTAYRMKKFLRKNKGPVIAASLVALALFGGIIGTGWGLVRADQAREREAQRAEGERIAKENAQAREAETKAVLDFVENKIFAAARPKDQEGGQGYEVKLADAITAALPFVEKSFADQPLIEARLRMTLGTSYFYLGKTDVAEQQFRRACAICTAKLGPDHPDTLVSMNNLASCYRDLGRYPEALALHEETLKLQKDKLGADDASTLISMNNLANSYAALYRYTEALSLYEESLKLRKAKLGPDHASTLLSMNNLANSYAALYRYTEALSLNEETLKLRKAKLGPDHPDTLVSMNNLANSYAALGRHPEALALHEETLKLQKDKFGADHPITLGTTNNLANRYDSFGRHSEALALREETLKLRKAKLGPDHSDTLMSMNDLAISYNRLGRHPEALALNEETLKLRKAKLGLDHPDTLMSMSNLVISYAKLGRHLEALALNDETLKLSIVKLGPDHTVTLNSMMELANNYAALGRHLEALGLREKTLALTKAKFGPDHPDTLGSMHNLANSYAALGRHPEAVTLREETLKLRKAKLGPDHPSTLGSMNNLAVSYTALGRHLEALTLREEILKVTNAKFGPDHPDTLMSMSNLAIGYARLGRHTEALGLREETHKLRKAKLGPDHANTLGSMVNLAESYKALGRLADATKLYEETLAITKVKIPNHTYTLNCMMGLAGTYAAIGRHPEARALCEEALKRQTAKFGANHPNTVESMYDLACSHGLVITKAEDRGKQAKLAMDWLKQAVAAGYKDVANMKQDINLNPLRDREDFKKLMAALEAKAAAAKKDEKK